MKKKWIYRRTQEVGRPNYKLLIYREKSRVEAEKKEIRSRVNDVQIENRGEVEVKVNLWTLLIDSRETILSSRHNEDDEWTSKASDYTLTGWELEERENAARNQDDGRLL